MRLKDASLYIARGISPAYDNDGAKVLNQKCIRDHRVSYSVARTTNPQKRKISEDKYLKPFDVLVNSTGVGTLGRVGQIKNIPYPTTVDSHITIVRPDAKIVDPLFFGYAMVHAQSQIERMGEGATGQTELSRTRLGDEVLIPDISFQSQKKIGEVLDNYDRLIENNLTRIERIEEIARLLYRHYFDVPEADTWELVTLDSCLTVCRGKSYKSSELSDSLGLPFVNLKCVNRGGGFRKDGLKRFTGTYKPSQQVQKGDLIMAVTDMTQDRMIVARTARVPSLKGGHGVISMDVVKLEPKEAYSKDYLYAMLRWSRFADEVKNHANGANVLHLLPARVTDYKLRMPPKELRDSFELKVSPLLDLTDVLQQKNDALIEARNLLLPRLISGEIEV